MSERGIRGVYIRVSVNPAVTIDGVPVGATVGVLLPSPEVVPRAQTVCGPPQSQSLLTTVLPRTKSRHARLHN